MLNLLQIPLPELFAVLAAVAFAAGLNVYATVAALGLLAVAWLQWLLPRISLADPDDRLALAG